ncbi:uncharacterized protein PAC_10038 [Phialocephala subalpina]|uniref:phospholipase A2 n=1 Tax=Phialocephala subalpina TaxID=576137 RepID=A0A1L7X542_9HELO|nr:uncharacterized protein PAC_10038 [Phialocephala subalpina]
MEGMSRIAPGTVRPLRLLSLDGGGVRGLSTIIILRHIMKNVSRGLGKPVEPRDFFDMIGGTSTGGLIAIMIGRLGLTLDQCQTAYLKLSKRIFNPSRGKLNAIGRAKDFLLADGKFDYKELEDAIKEVIVQDGNLMMDELLQDPESPCKVFVCALRTGNSETAILRTYENDEPELLYDDCKIWEACRATSAATTFFDPIKIGPFEQEFADGGVIYNNPVELVHREASVTWPGRMEDAMLISIGTGSAPGAAFEGNIKRIVEAMKEIVTQTERTADNFLRSHEIMANRDLYFRFNVYHGLSDVGLEEWKEKAKMADCTQTYLMNGETRRKVRYGKRVIKSLQMVCFIGTTDQSLLHLRKVLIIGAAQEYSQSLDYEYRLHRYDDIDEPARQTFEWIYNDLDAGFSSWLQNDEKIFWINGKAGSGKSTMLKFISDDPRTTDLLKLNRSSHTIVLAKFFFHDRGSALEKTFTGLLRALLLQILERWPKAALSVARSNVKSFRTHISLAEGIKTWSEADLRQALDLVKSHVEPGAFMCFFIDGLDEFDGEDWVIADFFLKLIVPPMDFKGIGTNWKVKLCLSSRPHNSFRDLFQGFPSLSIHEKSKGDILQYVSSRVRESARIERPALDSDDATIGNLIILIVERAHGVFLWVRLVVNDLLQSLADGDSISELRARLNMFSGDLESVYKRMLQKVRPRYLKETALLLHLVEYARRPLSLVGLFEAAATRLDTSSPSFVSDTDREVSVDLITEGSTAITDEALSRRIRSRCGGLLEIQHTTVSGKEHVTVQFLHQTVKELLARPDAWQEIFGVAPLPGSVVANLKLHSATLKLLNTHEKLVSNIDDCVYYVTVVEQLTMTVAIDLLDVMDQRMSTLSAGAKDFMQGHWSREYWKQKSGEPPEEWLDNFLAFAIAVGLSSYVIAKIRLRPGYVSRKKGRPLLHYAVTRTDYPVDAKLVTALLECGADPNKNYQEETAWQLFMSNVRDFQTRANISRIAGPFQPISEAMAAMLKHGAQVNTKVNNNYTGYWTRPVQIFLKNPEVIGEYFSLNDVKSAVHTLVSYGALIDIKDETNRTALEDAAWYDQLHDELLDRPAPKPPRPPRSPLRDLATSIWRHKINRS